MLTEKGVRKTVKLLDNQKELYKENHSAKKINWKTYEENYFYRLQRAMFGYKYYIEKVIQKLEFVKYETRGAKPKLTLKEKCLLLLLKELIQRSNREMSLMMLLFSVLTGKIVSYKTIERLYSDREVEVVFENIHCFILDERQNDEIDLAGDGTGYSMIISKHYASVAASLKDKAKENKNIKRIFSKKKRRKSFVYSFNLLDLKSRMYISYGTSFRSEKDAYNKAVGMLKKMNIKVRSIRLDRYYSGKSITEFWKDTQCYLIPKKNVTLKNSGYAWKDMLKLFVGNTQEYLFEYFKRNQSESCFSEDKRRFGWMVRQKRLDRIDRAVFARTIWHNLFWLKKGC